MGDSPKRTSLYVDNLHPEVEEKDLEETFGAVGPLVSVSLRHYETPRELICCAVVDFRSHTDACTALESLNRTELRGKPIRILWEDDEGDCDHVDSEEEEGSEEEESSEEYEGSEEGSEDLQNDYDYTKDPNLIQTTEDELADFNSDWFLEELMGKGLAAAAIYTLDCGMLWNDRGGFPVLTNDEFHEINRVINDPQYLVSELSLGGQRYRVTKDGPNRILLCVSMEGAARGCAVKLTDKLLVLGYYRPPKTAEQCAEAVHTIGEEIIRKCF